MATTCGREKAMYLVFCRSRQNKERINEQNETDARSPQSLTMKRVLQFSAAFPKITKWRSRHVGPVQESTASSCLTSSLPHSRSGKIGNLQSEIGNDLVAPAGIRTPNQQIMRWLEGHRRSWTKQEVVSIESAAVRVSYILLRQYTPWRHKYAIRIGDPVAF